MNSVTGVYAEQWRLLGLGSGLAIIALLFILLQSQWLIRCVPRAYLYIGALFN